MLIRNGEFVENSATPGSYVSVDDLRAAQGKNISLDLANDQSVEDIVDHFPQISLIRIAFPGFADGRGYSIARRLRQLGYDGALRAHGHLIPDQYPHALRAGFNELEIAPDLAQQKPAQQWQDQLAGMTTSYQERLQRPQF